MAISTDASRSVFTQLMRNMVNTRLTFPLGGILEQVKNVMSPDIPRTGPIVRVGPNELSFANPAAVRDIYTSKSFVKEETFYVRTRR